MTVRHWWVNHEQTSKREIEGSYLWSPKKNKSGSKNVSYDNMTRAVPGDIVLSYADGKIGAVGIVVDRVRSAPAPEDFGAGAEQWLSDAGWLLPVRFERLPNPLVPKNHMTELRPLLPAKHSPIRVSGDRNQSVYLAEIPAAMAAMLENLLGERPGKMAEEIGIETDDQLSDAAAEEQIWQRSDLGPREKRQLISARTGQGIFRESVERIEKSCRVTGALDRRHLYASHIKPWRVCDDPEKIDGFNGLLLSPHIDHLFARGHIAFTNDGRILVSALLNPTVWRAWGLDKVTPPRGFRPEQWVYLEYHRQYIFEKISRGRRT